MLSSCGDDAASAGFGVRLYAYGIDLLIKTVLVLTLRASLRGPGWFGQADGFFAPVLFNFNVVDIAAYLAGVAYFILFTYLSGATLGKRVFQLKVVKAVDEPVGLVDVIYRETVGRYLSSLLGIGYIYAAFSNQKRGFHDILANTRVIYDIKPDNPVYMRAPAGVSPAGGAYAPHVGMPESGHAGDGERAWPYWSKAGERAAYPDVDVGHAANADTASAYVGSADVAYTGTSSADVTNADAAGVDAGSTDVAYTGTASADTANADASPAS